MGVKIGPDGKIWYVNATTNEVIRIDGVSVGVDEVAAEMTMSVYPNPATSQVYVSSNSSFNISDVMIYDVTGKLVECPGSRINEHTIAVNIDKLSQGVYFAVLKNDTQIKTGRFVKK
ncbi:MAG: T9SS type A sorting domain-containing protein [Bacteroidetes bacterium]|nr:T9SS type A sorting domain-containing protein [Bacteroidota bacterium]